MNEKELLGRIENLLYAAGDSVSVDDMAIYFDMPTDDLYEILSKEASRREAEECGLILKFYSGRVQLATRPEYGDMIYDLLGKKSSEELSRAMLETLSIVAYRQPVTRPEREELRGVNSSYIVGVLENKGFIAQAGRKEVIGRPMTYVTTEKFLKHFGITDITQLPTLPEETQETGAAENEEDIIQN
ncbi:MAG: SMC-Scp complex subunit ScpB [Christensenellaceae bacterium]|nr:SMC-Scp complex subunit ScpB [Christensenellaceae bacterium]